MTLAELGWDEAFADLFAPFAAADVRPGRVAIEFNQIFRVYVDGGEIEAVTAGRLKHRAGGRAELPAVGDWVAVRKAPDQDRGVIAGVLPRRSAFRRRAAGVATGEQIVAANIDVVLVVMGLDADYSPRRLERYLLMARESGASPVVLLTKPDLSANVSGAVEETRALVGNVPIHVVRPTLGEGVDEIRRYLGCGRTAALLGSSGVGKSTILNRLVGAEIQRTRTVRASDSRGRHTTTHRALVSLGGAGLLIDTPGMRELQLWAADNAVLDTFDDIDLLAPQCHFGDCRHRQEPRCAVKAAVAAGELPEARLASYLKLQDELLQLAKDQEDAQRGSSSPKSRIRRL